MTEEVVQYEDPSPMFMVLIPPIKFKPDRIPGVPRQYQFDTVEVGGWVIEGIHGEFAEAAKLATESGGIVLAVVRLEHRGRFRNGGGDADV